MIGPHGDFSPSASAAKPLKLAQIGLLGPNCLCGTFHGSSLTHSGPHGHTCVLGFGAGSGDPDGQPGCSQLMMALTSKGRNRLQLFFWPLLNLNRKRPVLLLWIKSVSAISCQLYMPHTQQRLPCCSTTGKTPLLPFYQHLLFS